jgi:transposase
LIANPDLRGEAALIRKRDGKVFVKMVGWFPRRQTQLEGTLIVRTSAFHLLTLFNEKEEQLLVVNGDDIRQKIHGHESMLSRWHDDQKFERRRPKRKSRKTKEDVSRRCDKQHNRLKSFIDETCASIVGHALRRRLECISYDDTEHGYFLSFPWHKMQERLSAVCEKNGIRFERSSAAKNPATARKPTKTKEASNCE